MVEDVIVSEVGCVGRNLAVDDITPSHERKDIRIWMDGAFDMMHFGHMNAFRQGRALGMQLEKPVVTMPPCIYQLEL